MTAPRYRPNFPELARTYAEQGATDREVAEMFSVSERTLHRWKHAHPELADALAVGKEIADQRVEQSLYRRAIGYSHDAVKIFMPAGASEPVIVPFTEHVPPDTTAAIFWLKNRKPHDWRDKAELKIEGDSLAAVIEAARLRAAALSEGEIAHDLPVQPPIHLLDYQPLGGADDIGLAEPNNARH